MSTYDWLLMLHVTGAFFVLGGGVAAGLLNAFALRRERPSELAAILGLIQLIVPVIIAGSVATLLLGLWLVHHADYSYGTFWVWGALILWFVAGYLGSTGGRRQERARKLAEQLAAGDDSGTPELRALVHDRAANLMSYGSGVAVLLILILMIWKPGQ